MVDFAQSCKYLGKDISILKKRMFYDHYSKNRIDLFLNKNDYVSNDLRTIVVWDKKKNDLIEKKILKNKKIVVIDKMLISKNCYEDIYKDKIFWLDNFYNRPIDRKTLKLKNDIICYIVQSKNPVFKLHKMFFTSERRIVDSNIFNFKIKIRNKRQNLIHISDNFEEAKRNAFYLSRSKKNFPYNYFIKSQYEHKSIKKMFDKLNKEKKLKYIILRDKLNSNDDIDLLCNDYYLFKKTVDAQSFKHKNLQIISNSGDPTEDYGFKVSNFIRVKNKEVCIDIRYIGDGYFSRKWQINLLKRRAKLSNYYTIDKYDKLNTIIYHIVYHKGFINKKYIKYLKSNLDREFINIAYLKNYINKFIKLKSYEIPRPTDLTIPITLKLDINKLFKEFNLIEKQIEKNNFSGANKMLLNLAKYQGISCFFNIKFLVLIFKSTIKYFKQIVKYFLFKKLSRSHLKLFLK